MNEQNNDPEISPGSTKMGEVMRSPDEVKKMMKEVSWLSKVFSGRHNVKVVALPGKGAWTCGIDHRYAEQVDSYMRGEIDSLDELPSGALVPNLITIREVDFYTDPIEEIRRKTRHEAAHATHSDFKLLFEGVKKAMDEGYLPSTYMSAVNGPEDGWVNAMAAGESQAALDDFRNGYGEKLKEILPQLVNDPLCRQFGVNAINYWLTGTDFDGLDPRVVEITNKIRPALDKFFSSNSAQNNSDIFNKEIWPHIRDLEKEEIGDEELRQLINQIQEEMKGQQDSDQQGQPGEQSSELGQQIQQEMSQGSDGEEPIDLSKLSPETIEKLEKIIEGLDPEIRQQLEEIAKMVVDKRQSEKLNKEAPQVIQMEQDNDTGQYLPKIQESDPDEVRKAEERLEEFQGEEKERDRQKMEKARIEEEGRQRQIEAMRERQKKLDDMKKEGFDEAEEADYDRYKELEREIDPQYRELRQNLGRIFPRQLKATMEGYYYSGRPDPARVAREYPVGSHKFYERKAIDTSQQVNLAVWTALDISGSMSGVKIDESVKNIIMWSKLCEEFSIPFGIVLFGNSAEILKNSNQNYSDPQEKIKAGLIQKTKNPNQLTNLDAAVEIIGSELKNSRRKFPGMQGVALFVTDGDPQTGLVGEELRQKIDEIKRSFTMFAFGLGSGESQQQKMQQMLTFYFSQESTIVPERFEQLPSETARVMEPIMRRLAQQLHY